ncbi:glycosylphosphatidylinositol anchor biosynthesis [Coemansia sp. RSA 2052]|nr:glycosylphosphatidylinositol anchor biosynthesis [Coemansia sp. RSA 2052]
MKIMPTRIGVPFLSRRRDIASDPAAAAAGQSSPTRLSPLSHGFDEAVEGSATLPKKGSSASPVRTGFSRFSLHRSAADANAAASSGLYLATSRVAGAAATASSTRPAVLQPRRPWRKLLYIKQEYPDDYVDDTFLMELQKNANVRMYDYSTIVIQTTVITQHISSIMIFIAVFINLYRGSLAGKTLVWCSSISTVLGFIFWDILNLYLRTPEQRIVRLNLIKGAMFFALLLFGLSPILRTLTKGTSKDSIWAMTVIFFGVNLAFHDYSTGNLTNIRFPGSVSLNAAVLASVLLASQLDNNLSVFAFMSFALKWFALFPIFRRYLKRISDAASMATTMVLALMATALFMYINKAVALLHIFSSLFITFACPLWLIWVQRYKNEIHGPWDEARPIVHRYFH